MSLPVFHAINSLEGAAYLQGLQEDRLASAGIAIHGAWLEHSSSLEFFKGERLLPDSPVDMLVLYKAVSATFADWPLRCAVEPLASGGRIISRKQAEDRLSMVSDLQQAQLASRFLNHVIHLSSDSTAEQDLLYFLELFLRCVQQEGVIEAISSGAIKRNSDEMADSDYW